MLLSNAFRPDPRVQREAAALVSHGYRVTVICWDREVRLPAREQRDGIEIVRIHSVPSTYGAGWRQLFYLPRFWRESVRVALSLSPDLVHCHDLDTLYAGRQLARRSGCPLIYDAHEHYPAWASLYLPAPFVSALAWWERRLLRHVDATITASTLLRDEIRAAGFEPVIALGNFPDVARYQQVPPEAVSRLRTALGVGADRVMVAYVGGLARNRMLLPLVAAAAQEPEVQFHLWGDGHQRAALEQAAAAQPNVHYHGFLPPDELPPHFRAADIIYYCLRPDYPGARYNAPNTLAQAMAAGRPIIANEVGDLGRIVRETGCGVLLDDPTPEAIVAAIRHLKTPAARAPLGRNGLQAARETFNAEAVSRHLIALYETLLPRN
jgi:glycosyltransferase involved in cell wall biosynthesis